MITKALPCLCFFKDRAKERAKEIFAFLDANGDGKIDQQEFIGCCLLDEEMVNILNRSGKKVQKVFHVTEETGRNKGIKMPLENAMSIFDEIKNV